MADISKIKLGDTTYTIKDEWIRGEVARLHNSEPTSPALIFKDAVTSEAELPILADAAVGWTYKATASFHASFGNIENGDLIMCVDIEHGENVVSKAWTILSGNKTAALNWDNF